MKLRNYYILFRLFSIFLLSYPRLLLVKLTKNDEIAKRFLQKSAKKLVKAANIDVEVVGVENLDIDENIILISNHLGYYDIMLILANTNRILGFISKKSLEKFPVFRGWMKYYNSIFIDRNDLKAQVKSISQAVDIVKNKGSICFFPEGTRSKERQTFKAGSFKIATRSKAPVVCCTVINTDLAFEDRKTNKRQKAKIIFHKPVYYEEYSNYKKNELAMFFENIVYSEYE